MNCADILAKMTEETKRQLCDHLNAEPADDRTLLRLLTSPVRLAAVYERMEQLEKKTLELAMFAFGSSLFDWASLEKAGYGKLSGAALKVGLIRLLRRGVVFAFHNRWGERLFVVPDDTFGVWRQLVAPFPAERFAVPEPNVEEMREPGVGLSEQLLALAAYAVKWAPEVTRSGTIAKRHVQKLASRLRLADGDFAGMPIRFSGEGAYSPAFAFLLDMALKTGIVVRNDERLTVHPDALRFWFGKSDAALNAELYRIWRNLYPASDVRLRHFAHCLERLPPGIWFDVRAVFDWLRECPFPEWSKSAEPLSPERLFEMWIRPLAGWGWMQYSDGGGHIFARWLIDPCHSGDNADAGNVPADGLFVQPDFEIVALPGTPPAIRWELEMVAEHVRTDHVYVYRLTRESVQRALENGRQVGDIVRFLRRHAKYGVPEHVAGAVEQWGNEFGRVRLEAVTLLRCRSGQIAEEIGSNFRFAPFLSERIGETDWIVRTDQVAELMKILAKNGYGPGSSIRSGCSEGGGGIFPAIACDDQPPENGGEPSAPVPTVSFDAGKGLIYSSNGVQYYDIERTLPDIHDVYPGLRDIPPAWLKDCRKYHLTTQKELVRRALEWKAHLRLRLGETERIIIPVRLCGTNDRWEVIGYEQAREVRLTPDQWEHIQLVLPGIND